MAKFVWDKELIQMLITEYEQKENLYNPRHRDYCNRVKRDKAEKEIIDILKNISPKITQHLLRIKIQSIRSQFKRELRAMTASKKSGAGVEDVYQPRLWCFDQLKFLLPYCAMKASSSNIDDDPNIQNSNPAEESISTPEDAESLFRREETTNELCSSTPKKHSVDSPRSFSVSSRDINPKKKFNLKSEIAETLAQSRTLIDRSNCNKSDTNPKLDWVGKLVVSQLSDIKHRKIQKDTIWNIQCALRKGIENDENSAESLSSCSGCSRGQQHINIKSVEIIKPASTGKPSELLASKKETVQEPLEEIIDEDDDYIYF